jgi:hypothetical protein
MKSQVPERRFLMSLKLGTAIRKSQSQRCFHQSYKLWTRYTNSEWGHYEVDNSDHLQK